MADEPSPWLVKNVDLIPSSSMVLDVACGRGRHALFLAQHGWPVHAIDRDSNVLRELQLSSAAMGLPITTEVIDLESGSPALGTKQYGAVVVINYLHRPLMAALIDALAPEGVLVYETFTAGQALRGHPKNPAYLLQEGELARLVKPLAIVRSREGEFDGQLVASIVAARS